MFARLPTELLVKAAMRKCDAQSTPAYVLNKGEAESGTVVLKIILGMNQCKLLNQTRDIDGNLMWVNVYDEENLDETRADSYIKRAIDIDPDVWVIEVEDNKGRNPFEE